MKQKFPIENFDLLVLEVIKVRWTPKGHTPKLILFETLDPQNLYFDTNEANYDNLKFWPLRCHWGHISDLQEDIIKNQCYFQNPGPKIPTYRKPWSKYANKDFDLSEVIQVQ